TNQHKNGAVSKVYLLRQLLCLFVRNRDLADAFRGQRSSFLENPTLGDLPLLLFPQESPPCRSFDSH
ncbi:hypothetical protein P4480_32595, partial [Bacillus thuringiensis]